MPVLTQTQEQYLSSVVKDKTIIDLGCGNFPLRFSSNHCKAYIGIDLKTPEKIPNGYNFEIHDLSNKKEVDNLPAAELAIVSWPINHHDLRWDLILSHYPEVIYLGSNSDGSCCGNLVLWQSLMLRGITKIIPNRSSTLIHYNNQARGTKPHALEEKNGLNAWLGGAMEIYLEKAY